MENLSYTPPALTIAQGDSVTWTFPELLVHSATSDQGFWDSGARSNGDTYARTFTSAGLFGYHCAFLGQMRGEVKVPLTKTGSPAAGWTLRWSTAKAAGGRNFDVQTRRGSGPWTSFRTDTKSAKARFDPLVAGKYRVRARSGIGAAVSGWSPVRTVKVS